MSEIKLSLVEAKFVNAMYSKVVSAPYDNAIQVKLSYLKVSYSKDTDDVIVQTSVDEEESGRISLLKAAIVAWLIPLIQSLEYESCTDIKSVDATYDEDELRFVVNIVTDLKSDAG